MPWQKLLHPFAAAMTTISVFHIKALINVTSRHLGVAFNIPHHNIGIYATKLISFRFFLGFLASCIELSLYYTYNHISVLIFSSSVINTTVDSINSSETTLTPLPLRTRYKRADRDVSTQLQESSEKGPPIKLFSEQIPSDQTDNKYNHEDDSHRNTIEEIAKAINISHGLNIAGAIITEFINMADALLSHDINIADAIKKSGTSNQIKKAVGDEAKPIAKIGEDSGPPYDISYKLYSEIGVGQDKIMNAVLDEAWIIKDQGDGDSNRQKRQRKTKAIAFLMGVRIMEDLESSDWILVSDDGDDDGDQEPRSTDNENLDNHTGDDSHSHSMNLDEFQETRVSGFGHSEDRSSLDEENQHRECPRVNLDEYVEEHSEQCEAEDQFMGTMDIFNENELLGRIEEHLDGLTNAIDDSHQHILGIIMAYFDRNQVSDFIIENAVSITEEILDIKVIKQAISTRAPGVIGSPDYDKVSDIKSKIECMLRSDSSSIADMLTKGKTDQVAKQVIEQIRGHIICPRKVPTETQKNIEDTMVKMVIQAIIEEKARHIVTEIVNIHKINNAIKEAVKPTNVYVSFGVIRATFEYILIKQANAIAQDVKKITEKIKSTLVNTPEQTISNAMFAVVISEIIRVNSEKISQGNASAVTIGERVEKLLSHNIMQGNRRREYMVKYLAPYFAENIMDNLDATSGLYWKVKNIVSEAIKEIIEENADKIASGTSSPVTVDSISQAVQNAVTTKISDKLKAKQPYILFALATDIAERGKALAGCESEELEDALLQLISDVGNHLPMLSNGLVYTSSQTDVKTIANSIIDLALSYIISQDSGPISSNKGSEEHTEETSLQQENTGIATNIYQPGYISEPIMNESMPDNTANDMSQRIDQKMNGEIHDDKGRVFAHKIRKAVSVISFFIMALIRMIFLIKLYKSTNLAYDAYLILNIEAVAWGFVHMSLFPLTAKHAAITVMSIYVSTMTIFFFQLILDRFLFNNPLLIIKIQMWIILLWNLASIAIWGLSLYWPYDTTFVSSEADTTKSFGDVALWSPFLMFLFVSLIKNFLFPGIMPFALLKTDQAHVANVLVPPVYTLGSFLVIMLDGWGGLWDPFEISSIFKEWHWAFNFLWLLYIPQVAIFICIFMAIHGNGLANKLVPGNKPLVLFMDILMMFCSSIMESLSYVGVANYTSSHTNVSKNQGSRIYLEINFLLAELCRFVFSKASVGYNTLRNKYGLGMNVVHSHSRSPPGGWYWFRHSCRISFIDVKNDLKMNISEYL